jgi:hypothetical protein
MKNLKMKNSYLASYSYLLVLLCGFFIGGSPIHAAEVVNVNTSVLYADLQIAIDAAQSGDVLELEGIFIGPFSIFSKSLTLRGAGGSGITSEPQTILDGGGSGPVLTILGEAANEVNFPTTVLLQNLNIQNGSAENGGGILNVNAQTVLSHVFVINNIANSTGGGITNLLGSLLITEGSRISNNIASNGGGINNYQGYLTISFSEIKENHATVSGGGLLSGGISSMVANNTITNTAITGNTIFSTGGFLPIGGAGMYNGVGSNTQFFLCDISNNQANKGDGAGIYNAAILSITTSSLNGNYCVLGNGGGVYNARSGEASFRASKITHNITKKKSGGGIYNNRGKLSIKKTIIKSNEPDNIREV